MRIKRAVISGLWREVYGHYPARSTSDERQVYRTTDRYFEKYILNTDRGVYEIWAGGCRKKDLSLTGFEACPDFAGLKGLTVIAVRCNETTLALQLNNDACFIVGLCPEPNVYGHPERYIKLLQQAFRPGADPETAHWFEQALKDTEDFSA